MSQVRQNFNAECEAAINNQINMELYASYCYLSMSFYFDRDDVALPGIAKWAKEQSDEEREHAELFLAYQNKRGGRNILQDVKTPVKNEWDSVVDALTTALELEKTVNASLLKLHALAEEKVDGHFGDFLEDKFLDHQVDSIKEIAEMITKAKRCGAGLGEYMFDKEEFEEEG